MDLNPLNYFEPLNNHKKRTVNSAFFYDDYL